MSHTRGFKIILGACVAVICWLVVAFYNWVEPVGNIPVDAVEYNTGYINCTEDIIKYISSRYYTKFKLNQYNDSESVLRLTMHKQPADQAIEVGYSPIVAIFPDRITSNLSDNFLSADRGNGYSYYMTDMHKIIDAFLDSETGVISESDIGFSGKISNLKLAIPDNASIFRVDVINALIYCITKGEEVTPENKDYVLSSLNKLISNAEIVNNPTVYQDDTKSNILIIPEYITVESEYTLYPIYWNECYASTMYLVNKGDVSAEDFNTISEGIKSDTEMLRKTAIRNNVDGATVPHNSNFASQVNVITGQTNLEELLGVGYWK